MKGYFILILSLVLANTVTSNYHECPHDKLPKKVFPLHSYLSRFALYFISLLLQFLVRTHLEDSYRSKAIENIVVVGRNEPFNQPIRINLHYNFTFGAV